MKIAILLGAGSSLPAGFPCTRSLTDRILSGDGVRRHTDSTYFICNGQPTCEKATLPKDLVKHIHSQAERYYASDANRRANYKDVYYLIDQAWAEESGESENLAVHDFTAKLRKDMAPLVSASTNMEYVDLLNESRNYVADLVWSGLNRNASSSDHLNILEAACKSYSVSSISTLCHDVHVETYLRNQDISLADGFSDEEAGVQYWHGDFSSNDKIPFLKLHGSVNWFLLRPKQSESYYDDRVGIPLDVDHNHTKGKDGMYQTALDGRPLLLIGTFNKIPDYTRRIFRELHHQFRHVASR